MTGRLFVQIYIYKWVFCLRVTHAHLMIDLAFFLFFVCVWGHKTNGHWKDGPDPTHVLLLKVCIRWERIMDLKL